MPNNKIYSFNGLFYGDGFDKPIPLGPDNLVLRGSTLRNTDYVIGVVVYQGHDTKIMMNSSNPKTKFTKLEKLMYQTIAVTFLI